MSLLVRSDLELEGTTVIGLCLCKASFEFFFTLPLPGPLKQPRPDSGFNHGLQQSFEQILGGLPVISSLANGVLFRAWRLEWK